MNPLIDATATARMPTSARPPRYRWAWWDAFFLRAAASVLAMLLAAVPALANRDNGAAGWANSNATRATLTQPNTPMVTVELPGDSALFFRTPPATSTLNARGGLPGMYEPASLAATTQFISISPTAMGCSLGTHPSCSRGTMTITFSQPVRNPSLHLAGIGGFTSGVFMSTRMTLTGSSPAGASLASIATGAVNLHLPSANTVAAINNNGEINCVSGTNAGAGCGTVQVNGTVTSLTFAIAMRIDGGTGTGTIDQRDSFDLGFTFREDFSDAPATSFNSAQAPTHVLGDLRLGSTVDEDNVAVANATTSPFAVAAGADNNGANGDGADEDAITGFPPLTIGNTSYRVFVPVSGMSKFGMVCGWIDFDRIGGFTLAERACAPFFYDTTGGVTLDWNAANGNAPAGLTPGNNYARLRAGYTVAEIQTPDGKGRADSGEVEDYRLTVGVPLTVAKTWVAAQPGHAASVSVAGAPAPAGGTALDAVADTGSETDTAATPYSVVRGNTYTITEAFSVGAAGDYTKSLACTGNTGTGAALTYTPDALSGVLTVGSTVTAITCTFTNERTGSIIIIKDAVPNDAQDFAFTAVGAGLSDFSLDDDADPTLTYFRTFTGLAAGSYSVTETALAGWNLTGLTCVDPTSNSSGNTATRTASITLEPGEIVRCTFTNERMGTIVIIKDAVPNDAQDFAFTAVGTGLSDFSLDDDADPTLTYFRTFIALYPGSYSVTETALAGWNLTGLTCVDPTSNSTGNTATRTASITLEPGETVRCTFTNALLPRLTLVKTVTNDNGGTQAATAWTLSASGPTPISGITGTAAVTSAMVSPGTYALSESSTPTGYMAGTYRCAKNGGAAVTGNSIALAAGDTATCTIENDDSNEVDVSVVKTSSATTVVSGDSVTFSLSVSNAGPARADGARVHDPAVLGLNCTTLNCSAASGASCPGSSTVAGLQAAPGLTIPALPGGSSVTFVLTCTVTASGLP